MPGIRFNGVAARNVRDKKKKSQSTTTQKTGHTQNTTGTADGFRGLDQKEIDQLHKELYAQAKKKNKEKYGTTSGGGTTRHGTTGGKTTGGDTTTGLTEGTGLTNIDQQLKKINALLENEESEPGTEKHDGPFDIQKHRNWLNLFKVDEYDYMLQYANGTEAPLIKPQYKDEAENVIFGEEVELKFDCEFWSDLVDM